MPKPPRAPQNRHRWYDTGRIDIAHCCIGCVSDNQKGPVGLFYPAKRNHAYALDRDITPEKITKIHTNSGKLGSHKNIWKTSQRLKTSTLKVTINAILET